MAKPPVIDSRVRALHTVEQVLQAVLEERRRQDTKWGGPLHDTQWEPLDWHEMIADYNGWARRMWAMGSTEKAKKRFIQVAALAVAAIQAMEFAEVLQREVNKDGR